jgi:hypothetical protein
VIDGLIKIHSKIKRCQELTLRYVFPDDFDVFVPVWATLHMVEAEGMQEFVNYGTMPKAPTSNWMPPVQVQHLVSTLVSYVGETATSISLKTLFQNPSAKSFISLPYPYPTKYYRHNMFSLCYEDDSATYFMTGH